MTRNTKSWAYVGIASFEITVLVYIVHWCSIGRFVLSDPYQKEYYVANSSRIQNNNDQVLFQRINSTNKRINEYDFTSLAPQVDGSISEEVADNIKHFLFSAIKDQGLLLYRDC